MEIQNFLWFVKKRYISGCVKRLQWATISALHCRILLFTINSRPTNIENPFENFSKTKGSLLFTLQSKGKCTSPVPCLALQRIKYWQLKKLEIYGLPKYTQSQMRRPCLLFSPKALTTHQNYNANKTRYWIVLNLVLMANFPWVQFIIEIH